MELGVRYIGDKKLPDKAIDVIDELGSQSLILHLKGKNSSCDLEEVIAKMARIPSKKVNTNDRSIIEPRARLETSSLWTDNAVTDADAVKLLELG